VVYRACDRRKRHRSLKLEKLFMSFDIERATTLLAEARRTGQPATVFQPGPADVDEAYAVQDRIAAMLGPVGGWKVGAKTPDGMPNTAPLLQDLVQTSPAAWPKHVFHLRGVEAEIAFKIGRDIPAGAGVVDEATAFAAVESVHAAIEIVDTRLAHWNDADPLWQACRQPEQRRLRL
jgi:2-keto-4-pentenoate hydratase